MPEAGNVLELAYRPRKFESASAVWQDDSGSKNISFAGTLTSALQLLLLSV